MRRCFGAPHSFKATLIRKKKKKKKKWTFCCLASSYDLRECEIKEQCLTTLSENEHKAILNGAQEITRASDAIKGSRQASVQDWKVFHGPSCWTWLPRVSTAHPAVAARPLLSSQSVFSQCGETGNSWNLTQFRWLPGLLVHIFVAIRKRASCKEYPNTYVGN